MRKLPRRFSVPLPPETAAEVARLAEKWDRSEAYVLRKLVETSLKSGDPALNKGEVRSKKSKALGA